MPADFADEAQEINENFLANALANRPKTSVPFSGFCLNCEEPVHERRYCDSSCREEHEAQTRKGQRLYPAL